MISVNRVERPLIECHKIETKVITMANHNKRNNQINQ